MSVRAKFKVTRIERFMSTKAVKRERPDHSVVTEYVPCETWNIRMSPVSGGGSGSENAAFWNATPGGEIQLMTVNADAVQQFNLGGEFYVDFTPATQEA